MTPPPKTLENWLRTATEHEGSWWPDWADWITTRSGAKVSAPIPGDGKLEALEDAPGSYVTCNIRVILITKM